MISRYNHLYGKFQKFRYNPITKRLMRGKISFNRGRGALHCRSCGCVIKEKLTLGEWLGFSKRTYCYKCAREMLDKMFKVVIHQEKELIQ